MIDTLLGKYRILERLGEGGMGAVYKARDELIDRVVAIKVLRPELTGNQQLLDRFKAEAVALARLNHPKIAMLHGLEQNGSDLFMVMEFLPGETVEKMIERMGRIPWPRAVAIATDVLAALDHAHDMGVVHRDIKPANVMVGPGGVKVMDFGIARIAGSDRNTRVGHTVGTPVYMSPEQLRGEEVDGRADLYAVGGMLYEMITGSVTFEADSDFKLMMKQLNDPPPFARSLVSDIPAELDDVIQRALAKRKEDRFVSAAAMQSALNATLFARKDTASAASAELPDTIKATRFAGTPAAPVTPSGTAPVHPAPVAATRVANGVSPVSPGTPAALYRDWRLWVAAVGAVIALWILLPRGGSVSGETPATDTVTAGGENALPRATDAGSDPAGRQSPGGTVTETGAGFALPGETSLRAPAVATNVPIDGGPGTTSGGAQGAGGTGAPPAEAREAEARKPTPRPAATAKPNTARPPERQVTSGVGTGTGATGGTAAAGAGGAQTPPRSATAPSQPSPDRGAAQAAVTQLLALLRNREAEAFAAAFTSTALSEQFLAAIREGRVSAAVPTNITLGDDGTVSFGTTLSWRTPFGSNRKGTMRISGSIVSSGGTWRVTRARLLEVPEVR